MWVLVGGEWEFRVVIASGVRQSVLLPLYVKPQIHFSGQTGVPWLRRAGGLQRQWEAREAKLTHCT